MQDAEISKLEDILETVNKVHLLTHIIFDSVQTILAALAVIYMLIKLKRNAGSAEYRVPASTWL